MRMRVGMAVAMGWRRLRRARGSGACSRCRAAGHIASLCFVRVPIVRLWDRVRRIGSLAWRCGGCGTTRRRRRRVRRILVVRGSRRLVPHRLVRVRCPFRVRHLAADIPRARNQQRRRDQRDRSQQRQPGGAALKQARSERHRCRAQRRVGEVVMHREGLIVRMVLRRYEPKSGADRGDRAREPRDQQAVHGDLPLRSSEESARYIDERANDEEADREVRQGKVKDVVAKHREHCTQMACQAKCQAGRADP